MLSRASCRGLGSFGLLAIAAACGSRSSLGGAGGEPEPADDGSAFVPARGRGGSASGGAGAGGSASVSDGGSANVSAGAASALAGGAGGAGGVPGLANPLCGSSVSVVNQAQLDALEGCEVIYGTLNISYASDLRPLHALREVRGELYLYTPLSPTAEPPERPQSFEGLENLEYVGYTVSIQASLAPSLAPFSRLHIDGPMTLRIIDCDNLESFEGLELSGPFVNLQVTDNARLTTLDPVRVTDTEVSRPYIEIAGNPSLRGLDALSGVVRGTRMALQGVLAENLGFLANLKDAEDLRLDGFPLLVDAGLPNVEALGSLALTSNALLVDAPDYPKLERLGELLVADNPQLRAAPRLPAQASDELASPLRIWVSGNGQLSVFELPELVTANAIRFDDNVRLETVSFPQLVEIDPGDTPLALGLYNNSSLTTLGLPRLGAIRGLLQVIANPRLDAAAFAPLVALGPTQVKAGLNRGDVADLDPCPWLDDAECDEEPIWPLCARGADGRDCARYR